MNYIEKPELKRLIITAQETGEVSERLVEVLCLIADGVVRKYGCGLDRDDYRQECIIRLLAVVQRIDVRRNIFSFLTTCAVNCGRCMAKGIRRYETGKFKLLQRLRESQESG